MKTSAILLALAAICASCYVGMMREGKELDQRSRIDAPEERIVQGQQDLAQALNHLHQAGASDNHLELQARMFVADREDWKRQAANVAAQRGWYAHSIQENPMRIIVPERDRDTLAGIQEDAYGWLEEMRSAGPATAPSLGENPVHVSIQARPTDSEAEVRYLVGILAIPMGFILAVGGIAALPRGIMQRR